MSSEERKNSSELSLHSSEVPFASSEVSFLASVKIFQDPASYGEIPPRDRNVSETWTRFARWGLLLYLYFSYLCTTFLAQREISARAMISNEGEPLAQLVEHNTFNVGVMGSSPMRLTDDRLAL